MIYEYVCPDCREEVEAEVFQGRGFPGDYVECPVCGMEIEVIVHHDQPELDEFWEDTLEDALSEASGRPSVAAI